MAKKRKSIMLGPTPVPAGPARYNPKKESFGQAISPTRPLVRRGVPQTRVVLKATSPTRVPGVVGRPAYTEPARPATTETVYLQPPGLQPAKVTMPKGGVSPAKASAAAKAKAAAIARAQSRRDRASGATTGTTTGSGTPTSTGGRTTPRPQRTVTRNGQPATTPARPGKGGKNGNKGRRGAAAATPAPAAAAAVGPTVDEQLDDIVKAWLKGETTPYELAARQDREMTGGMVRAADVTRQVYGKDLDKVLTETQKAHGALLASAQGANAADAATRAATQAEVNTKFGIAADGSGGGYAGGGGANITTSGQGVGLQQSGDNVENLTAAQLQTNAQADFLQNSRIINNMQTGEFVQGARNKSAQRQRDLSDEIAAKKAAAPAKRFEIEGTLKDQKLAQDTFDLNKDVAIGTLLNDEAKLKIDAKEKAQARADKNYFEKEALRLRALGLELQAVTADQRATEAGVRLGIMQQNADSTRISATRPKGGKGAGGKGASSTDTKAAMEWVDKNFYETVKFKEGAGDSYTQRKLKPWDEQPTFGHVYGSLAPSYGKNTALSIALSRRGSDLYGMGKSKAYQYLVGQHGVSPATARTAIDRVWARGGKKGGVTL